LFWLRFPSVDLVDEERLETYENNLLKHYEGNKIKDIPEYPGLCLWRKNKNWSWLKENCSVIERSMRIADVWKKRLVNLRWTKFEDI
jgi:hypothetical protein